MFAPNPFKKAHVGQPFDLCMKRPAQPQAKPRKKSRREQRKEADAAIELAEKRFILLQAETADFMSRQRTNAAYGDRMAANAALIQQIQHISYMQDAPTRNSSNGWRSDDDSGHKAHYSHRHDSHDSGSSDHSTSNHSSSGE